MFFVHSCPTACNMQEKYIFTPREVTSWFHDGRGRCEFLSFWSTSVRGSWPQPKVTGFFCLFVSISCYRGHIVLIKGSSYIRAMRGKRKGIWVTEHSTVTETVSTTENEACGLLWPHSVVWRPRADSRCRWLVFLKWPLLTSVPHHQGDPGKRQEREQVGKRCFASRCPCVWGAGLSRGLVYRLDLSV